MASRIRLFVWAVACVLLLSSPAGTQNTFTTPNASTTIGTVPLCLNGSSQAIPAGATCTFPPASDTTLNSVLTAVQGPIPTQAATTPIGGIGLLPTTTGGLSNKVVEPAANDNHQVVKAGAGQVYGVHVFNNSATINYGRLYNATTGFNGCNSATNLVYEFHIPASTNDAGFVVPIPQGLAFATGISLCVTGAYGQTDTSNATASAISLNILYF